MGRRAIGWVTLRWAPNVNYDVIWLMVYDQNLMGVRSIFITRNPLHIAPKLWIEFIHSLFLYFNHGLACKVHLKVAESEKVRGFFSDTRFITDLKEGIALI